MNSFHLPPQLPGWCCPWVQGDIAMVISIGAKIVPDCRYPNAMIDGISAGYASVDAASLHFTPLRIRLSRLSWTCSSENKLITTVDHCMQ